MNRALDGRVALITGAGRRIGRAVARRFAGEGARIAVATRTAAHGNETVAAVTAAGGEAALFAVDVGTHGAVKELVRAVAERFGAVDIVVHNAGLFPRAPLAEADDDGLDRCFDVNLKAAFWLAAEALPYLARSAAARFLCVSSITGNRIVNAGYGAYGASKAALNAFVRQAAAEFAPQGVRVNGVEPGSVGAAAHPPGRRSDASRRILLESMTTPDDIAGTLLFLASDAGRQITGQTIVVDGGQSLSYVR